MTLSAPTDRLSHFLRCLLPLTVLLVMGGVMQAATYRWHTAGSGDWPDSSNWQVQGNLWTGYAWTDITDSSYPGSSSSDDTVYINTDEDVGNNNIIVYVTQDISLQNLFFETSDDTTITIVLSEGVTLTVGTLTFGHLGGGNSDQVNVIITGPGTIAAGTATYSNSDDESTISIENGAVLTTYSFGGNSGQISVTGDGSGTLVTGSTGSTVQIDESTVTVGNDTTKCYVTLLANGGSFGSGGSAAAKKTLSVTKGQDLTLTEADLLNLSYTVSAAPGKAFLGWSHESGASEADYADGALLSAVSASQTLYAVWADVTSYYWNPAVSDGDWTDSSNWQYTPPGSLIGEEPAEGAVFYSVRGGYPGLSADDQAHIPAGNGSTTTVTLTQDISLFSVQFGMARYYYDSSLVLDTAGHELSMTTCVLHNRYDSAFNSSLTVTGSGSLETCGFDAPNGIDDGSGQTPAGIVTNTVTINSGSSMRIKGGSSTAEAFWGDGDDSVVKTVFAGSGTLYVLASGANVEFGPAAIEYDSGLTREPEGSPTYYTISADYETSPVSDSGLQVTFGVTRTSPDDSSEQPISFTYYAETTGSASVSDFSFAGVALTGSEQTVSFAVDAAGSDFVHYLTYEGLSSLSEGDGITLSIYTPDKSLVLAKIVYTASGFLWQGTQSSDWTDGANWSGGQAPDQDDTASEIVIPSGCSYYPLLTENDEVTVGAVTILSSASLTMTGGSLTLSSLTTEDTGAFSASGGTLVFTGSASYQADYASYSSFCNVKVLTGGSLTLGADMEISGNLIMPADGSGIARSASLNLAGKNVSCGAFLLFTGGNIGSATGTVNASATLTGGGRLSTKIFNFPNISTHSLTIDSGTSLEVTEVFYGDILRNYTSLTISGSGSLILPASGAYLNELNGSKAFSIASSLTVQSTGSPSYYSVSAEGSASGIELTFTVVKQVFSDASSLNTASVPFYYWAEPVDTTGSGNAPAISDFTLNGSALDSNATSSTALAATADSFAADSSTTLTLTYSGSSLADGAGGRLHIYTPDGLFELLTVEYIQGATPVWTGAVSSSWTEGGNWSCGYPPAFGAITIPGVTSPCLNPVITASDGPAAGLTFTEVKLTGDATLEIKGGTLSSSSLLLTDTATVLTEGDAAITADSVTADSSAVFWLTDGSLTVTKADAVALSLSDNAVLEAAGGTMSITSLSVSDSSLLTLSGGSASLASLSASGGSMVTLSGSSVTISGDFTASGGSHQLSGGSLSLSGALELTGDSWLSISGGTLSASSLSTAGDSGFEWTGGGVTLSGALALNGSLGASFASAGSKPFSCASFAVGAGVEVTQTEGSLQIAAGGSWSVDSENAGSFTASAGSVQFAGSASLSGDSSFYSLIFAGDDSTVTAGGKLTVTSAAACTGSRSNLAFSGDNSFAIFLAGGPESTISFSGKNTFSGGTSGGAYLVASGVTMTFADENTFDNFSVYPAGLDAQISFLEANLFGNLSVKGPGASLAFAPGKTQTVTENLTVSGTETAPVILTSSAAAPSVDDTSTWWILDTLGSKPAADALGWTEISYSRSVTNIAQDWGDTVTEGLFASTANWFLRIYYWQGSQDSHWSEAGNWSLTLDGSQLSQTFPDVNGSDSIVIATAEGGHNLILEADLYADSLRINSGSLLDAAGYSIAVNSLDCQGSLRLTGSAGQVITADSLSAGEESCLLYYGSVASLPWDQDPDTAGLQYTNLVFEADASFDGSALSDLLAVSESLTLESGASLTLGSGGLSIGQALTNQGKLIFTTANSSLTIPAYSGASDGSDRLTFAGGSLLFESGASIGSLTFTGSSSLSTPAASSGSLPPLSVENLSIESGASLSLEAAAGSPALSVSSSWNNQAGKAGFAAHGGSVYFTGSAPSLQGESAFASVFFVSPAAAITVSGDNSFESLTATGQGSSLTVSGNLTVTGALILTGSETDPISLGGSGAFITPRATFTGSYLTLDDSLSITESADDLAAGSLVPGAFSVTDSSLASGASYPALFARGWKLAQYTSYVWTGSASTAWEDGANWDLGLVPGLVNTSDAQVVIPDDLSSGSYPVAGNRDYLLEALTIGSASGSAKAASVTLSDGSIIISGRDDEGLSRLQNWGSIIYSSSGRMSDGSSGINDSSHDGWVDYRGSGLAVSDFGDTDYANLRISGPAGGGSGAEAALLAGDISVTGAFESSLPLEGAGKALTVAGKASLGADISGCLSLTFQDAVTLTADTSLTLLADGSQSPSLTIGGALTGAYSLTLDAAGGSASLQGSLGSSEIPLAALSLSGQGAYSFDQSLSAASFTCSVEEASVTFSGNVSISGALTNSGSLTMTSAGTSLSFGSYSRGSAGSDSLTLTAGTSLVQTGAASSVISRLEAQSAANSGAASQAITLSGGGGLAIESASYGGLSFTTSGSISLPASESASSSESESDIDSLTVAAGSTRLCGSLSMVDLFIASGATLAAGNNEDSAITLTLSGSWTNEGAFTANKSTVCFTGSRSVIQGSNSFSSLSCEKAGGSLVFQAGSTQTVTGFFSASGDADALLSLESASPGSQWILTVAGEDSVSVSYVVVSDSYSSYDSITAYNSQDGGNNSHWLFDTGLSLPAIALSLAPLGENQFYAIFSGRLFYKGQSFDELSAEGLSEALSQIPEILLIRDGSQASSQLAIEKAAYVGAGSSYSVLHLTLEADQTIGLDHLRSLSLYVKRLSDGSGQHYHVLSDFALNLVEPLYAHADFVLEAGSAPSQAISQSVHDFTADSTDCLHSNADIFLQARLTEENIRPVLIADAKSALPAGSQSTVVNAALGTKWRVWLPSSLETLSQNANSNSLRPLAGEAASTSQLWNFSLENEETDSDGYKWQGGEEVQFLFKLTDMSGSDILLDSDGDGSGDRPLYALSLAAISSGTLPALDLWSFKIKDAKSQQGGVTILNNVIDVAGGEECVLQVDLAEAGNLNIYVLTADGNIVRRLEQGQVTAGSHRYSWNGRNKAGRPVARGLYFIRIKGDKIDETRKVLCVKE